MHHIFILRVFFFLLYQSNYDYEIVGKYDFMKIRTTPYNDVTRSLRSVDHNLLSISNLYNVIF